METEKSPHAFKTISEVADDLQVPAHVLRFWEQKFPHIQPLKRRGGRRYYRPEDVDALKQIQKLLYEEGYTIRGAMRYFAKKPGRPAEAPRTKSVVQTEELARELNAIQSEARKADKEKLQSLLQSLKEMRELLKDAA